MDDDTTRATPFVKAWLKQRLRTRAVRAGVLGLGRHGLSVAISIATAGFTVTGIDVDSKRVATINAGHVEDAAVLNSVLSALVHAQRLRATQSFMTLEHLDVVTVCVPTLFPPHADPDFSCLIAAVEAIRIHLHPGLLIIIDSNISSALQTQVVLPILQRSGLQIGVEFFLAQRLRHVVPGPWLGPLNAAATRLVGITQHCRELASLYYQYLGRPIITI